MKSLQESLLDDEDILINNTDLYKGFPDINKYKTITNTNGIYSYYRWKNDPIIKKTLYSMGYYAGNVLYIDWHKPDNDRPNQKYIIRIRVSKNSFANSINMMGFKDESCKTEKEAQKLAYELLTIIKNHPNILNYIYDNFGKFYSVRQKEYNMKDLKKEFKDF